MNTILYRVKHSYGRVKIDSQNNFKLGCQIEELTHVASLGAFETCSLKHMRAMYLNTFKVEYLRYLKTALLYCRLNNVFVKCITLYPHL